jgi:hypothetical protein
MVRRAFGAGMVALALIAAACGRTTKGPGPLPSTLPAASVPELKLKVLDAVGGHLDYCDPDLYPIGHGTPVQNARERLPAIKADAAVYRAILDHEHLDPAHLSDTDLVRISEDYKQMSVIRLVSDGARYRFAVSVPTSQDPFNQSVSGTVDPFGRVLVESRGPGQPRSCPICLAAGTRISTPRGPIPVQDIVVGMPVWSTGKAGNRIRSVVMTTRQMSSPPGHEVVRLTVADGRTLWASPGHPTADGRRVGDLRHGDLLDGSTVVSAVRIAYGEAQTYDLLPSGPTGSYFANGILLGSTLGG